MHVEVASASQFGMFKNLFEYWGMKRPTTPKTNFGFSVTVFQVCVHNILELNFADHMVAFVFARVHVALSNDGK